MLKGAIKMAKDAASKVVNTVGDLLNDDIKTRKIGVFIIACGIGLVAVSYVR